MFTEYHCGSDLTTACCGSVFTDIAAKKSADRMQMWRKSAAGEKLYGVESEI